jgi:hypothetical protein
MFGAYGRGVEGVRRCVGLSARSRRQLLTGLAPLALDRSRSDGAVPLCLVPMCGGQGRCWSVTSSTGSFEERCFMPRG